MKQKHQVFYKFQVIYLLLSLMKCKFVAIIDKIISVFLLWVLKPITNQMFIIFDKGATKL